MKKVLYIFIAIALVFSFSSCNGLKKMMEDAEDINYKVEPEVLEMHGGEVEVKISGQFPEKYFNKKVQAEVTPVLVYEGGEKALSPVYVQGEKIEGNGTVIQYQPGGQFSYTDKFDFVDEMMVSTLEIRIKASKGSKEVEFDPEPIAKGVVATPKLVETYSKTKAGDDKFVKDIADKQLAVIYYDKNQGNIKHSELTKDDVKALEDYIKIANENERREFNNIEVKAYASPEGSQEINTKVSGDRAKSAQGMLDKKLKEVEEAENDDFVEAETTVEDWDGFKKMVQESDLAEKDMILRVVQMHSDPAQREEELRKMTKTFDELEDVIHPQLRRSEIAVNITLIGHSDNEIKELYENDTDSLTQEELLYVATLYEDLNKKLEIYTAYTEKYNKDWRGFNNVGVIQYELNNIDAAKTALEKAKSLDANATVANNLGNVALLENDIEAAMEYFETATGVNEASYGLGIINIKKGVYGQAVDYFGDDCSFNAGLAKLLNGDTDGAIAAVDCATDDNPKNYYLKAIAYARKANKDEVMNNLRNACGKDPVLKSYAAKDMEFHMYFDDPTFKEIVK